MRAATLIFALSVSWAFDAGAQLRVLQSTEKPGPANKLTTESVQTNIAGDHEKALSVADAAIKADPNDPWTHYARGQALASLSRVDEAIVAFRQAERRFVETDHWGKSTAIWAQANVLRQAGRCVEATPVYERYATFVEKIDSAAAQLARKYSAQCASRGP